MARRIGRLFDRLEEGLALLMGVALMLLTGAIVFDVVGRQFFGASAPWTVEVSEHVMLYLTFLSAPWILRENAHVRIEFLTERLRPDRALRLMIAIGVVLMIVCALAGWYALQLVLDDYERGIVVVNMLRIPRWLARAAMPLGFFLLAIEFARRVFATYRELPGAMAGEDYRT